MKTMILPLAAGLVMMMSADAYAQQPTDNQKVLGAVIAANEAEVALAELALSKTQDTQVREFALMLRRDHSALLGKLRPMASAPNPVAADDPELRRMKTQSDEMLGMLQRLDTLAFDSLYMEQMVTAHEKMLSMIDSDFLPNSQGELRSALEGARPKVQEHLRQARALAQRKRGMDQPMVRRDTSLAPPAPTRRPPRS